VNITEITVEALTGGQSTKVALSTVSAQTAAVSAAVKGVPVRCLVTLDATGFVRKGTNPTAVADGTDQILLANNTYRVELMDGEKLAVVLAAGTGNLYFTPNA
jgi:hypothetical protein